MLSSSSPEEYTITFALSDCGSPYIIVLLCLKNKQTNTHTHPKPAVIGAGRVFACYFLSLVVCNEGIAQKWLPSVPFRFKGLFIQKEVFSLESLISQLHFQGNGYLLSSHYVNFTKGSCEGLRNEIHTLNGQGCSRRAQEPFDECLWC